jgi:hypothetical protein
MQVALNIGLDGAITTPPETIRDNLIAKMEGILPDYTANLPLSLVENMTSTPVYALAQCEQAYIELINSISPTNSNLVILNQQAVAAGILGLGQPSRTSVYVVFSGVSGYIIPRGFLVGDSIYQYEVQDGGVIGSGGHSEPLYCLATQDGSWSVPAAQVTQLGTSVPTGYTLTVNNPTDGLAGGESETVAQFRARVLRSWTYTSKGMTTYLKELLYQVSGVQQRLVSVKQQVSGLWSIICGGGDPYEVGNEIFTALFDIASLAGSATTARNVTVNLYDYPDTYQIVFINPPVQTVAITVTWNTTSTYLVSNAAVNALAINPLIAYINSIPVGSPINDLTLAEVFKESIASILAPELLTRLIFSVSINGAGVTVAAGTHTYLSESESYFSASVGSIVINQG